MLLFFLSQSSMVSIAHLPTAQLRKGGTRAKQQKRSSPQSFLLPIGYDRPEGQLIGVKCAFFDSTALLMRKELGSPFCQRKVGKLARIWKYQQQQKTFQEILFLFPLEWTSSAKGTKMADNYTWELMDMRFRRGQNKLKKYARRYLP